MTATLLIGSAAAKPQLFQKPETPPKAEFEQKLDKPAEAPVRERLKEAATDHKANQAEAIDTEPNAHREVLDSLEKELPPEVAEAVWAWLNGQPQPAGAKLDLKQIQAVLTELGIQTLNPQARASGITLGTTKGSSNPASDFISVSFGKPSVGGAQGNFTQILLPPEEPVVSPPINGQPTVPPPPSENPVKTDPIGEIIVFDPSAESGVDPVEGEGVSNEAIKDFLLGGKTVKTEAEADTGEDASAETAESFGDFKLDPKATRTEGHSIFQTRFTEAVKEAPKPLTLDQTQAVRQQAIDQILEMAQQQPGRSVTVRLHPEELGSITVQLVHREDGHEVQVKASHDSVRAALSQSRHELSQNLEAKGVNLLSFDVSSDSANADTSAQQQRLNQDDFSAAHRLFGGGKNQEPLAAPRPGSLHTNAGVNYLA